MEIKEIWEVDMWKNIGAIEVPIMNWVTEKRYYYAVKNKTDFDLYGIERVRKNAKLIDPSHFLTATNK